MHIAFDARAVLFFLLHVRERKRYGVRAKRYNASRAYCRGSHANFPCRASKLRHFRARSNILRCEFPMRARLSQGAYVSVAFL